MADEITLSEADLHDACANLDFIAFRFKGILRLAEKMAALRALIAEEQNLRDRVAELQQRLDVVNATIAAGATAKARLDKIDGEIEACLHQAEAKAADIIEAARGSARDIVAVARNDANKIRDDARAAATLQAEHDAAAASERKSAIAALDAEVTERQAELKRINQELAELRQRIGAR